MPHDGDEAFDIVFDPDDATETPFTEDPDLTLLTGLDHGVLSGLTPDDDHPQYLREKAYGGLAAEIPLHTHANNSEAGPVAASAIDHGGLSGLADDDHPQYRLESEDHTHQSTGLQGGTLDHGAALTGLTDDDHTQYLKEKANGGVAAEVPTHAHSGGAEAGTVDHGVLTGLSDDDHTQYLGLTRAGEQDVTNGVTFSAYIRIGSATSPTNVTAGDATAVRLLLGDDAAFSLTNETLRVNRSSYVPTNADEYNVNITTILAPGGTAGTSNRIGVRLQMLVRPTAADGNRYGGLAFDLQHDSGAFNLSHASSSLVGVNGTVTQAVAATTVTFAGVYRGTLTVSNGTVTTADIFATAFSGTGGTAITTLRHYNVVVNNYPTALTTHVGLNVPNLGNAAVTNAIGIDIAAQSGAGTLNFGIRNASNESVAAWLRVGSNSAPANTTAGDFTCVRINIGNGAFSAGNGLIIRVTSTLTDTASGATIFTLFSPTLSPATNSSADFRVFYQQAIIAPSTGVTMNQVESINIDNRYRTDAAVSELDGIFMTPIVLDSSTPASAGTLTLGIGLKQRGLAGSAGKALTITTFVGIDSTMIVSTGGSLTACTTMSDIRINADSSGGTVTTRRGIQIANLGLATYTTAIAIDITTQSGAGTNFDIRSGGNSVFGGYVRVGAVTAPTNTTAGDLTCIRLKVGDGAFGSGVEFSVTGDGALSGFLRVGSETAPTNTTAGDLTCVRLKVGDGAFGTGAEFSVTGDGAFSGWLRVGSETAPTNTTAGDFTAIRAFLTGLLDLSGISAGTANIKITATSDVPGVTWGAAAGNEASAAPAGYLEIDVGGNSRYIPFWA